MHSAFGVDHGEWIQKDELAARRAKKLGGGPTHSLNQQHQAMAGKFAEAMRKPYASKPLHRRSDYKRGLPKLPKGLKGPKGAGVKGLLIATGLGAGTGVGGIALANRRKS
jgi:hypothetical protein